MDCQFGCRPHLESLLLCQIFLVLFVSVASAIAELHVPAIYVFGDSTADVGNNNFVRGGVDFQANYAHNGIDYPHKVSTGRFGNGYVGVDFLAKKLGHPESPPAALSTSNDVAKELRGVNFASGGAGVLDITNANVSLSMNEQVKLFENVVGRLIKSKGQVEAHRLLAKSLFIFSVANNDIFVNFFLEAAAGKKTATEKDDQFVALVVSQYKGQLKRLYDLGARKFAVFGMGLIGCIPVVKGTIGNGKCIERLNSMAQRFNINLKKDLSELADNNEGFKYSFADTYAIGTDLFLKASRLGFKELNSACCGTGMLRAQSPCTEKAPMCPNRDEYFSWDRYHPTQAVHKLYADYAYTGDSIFTTPMNFQTLAKSY